MPCSFSIKLNQTIQPSQAQIITANSKRSPPPSITFDDGAQTHPKAVDCMDKHAWGLISSIPMQKTTNNEAIFHSNDHHISCRKYRRRAACIAGRWQSPNPPHRPSYYPTSIHPLGLGQRHRYTAACVSFCRRDEFDAEK